MELFKTAELKNEYKEFLTKLLPDVLNCNFCNISCCEWHSKSIGACIHCRKRHCKKCHSFNISKDILLASATPITVDYIYNYICDFLNLSDLSIKTFFPDIKVEKIGKINYRTRVKSEKNRSQILKCEIPSHLKNGQYQFRNYKRRFYY